MTPKRAILFDFDGTIIDSTKIVRNIISGLSQKYGLSKISENDLRKARGKGFREILKDLGISKSQIPFFIKDGRNEFGKNIDKVKIVKGILKVLFELKKKDFILGVMTSNSRKNIEYFLRKYNLNFFDYINAGVSLFGKKRRIINFLKKNNLSKEDVIYIGDEVRDVESAKAAGVKAVAVCWGFNSEEILRKSNPDFMARKPSDLLKFCN